MIPTVGKEVEDAFAALAEVDKEYGAELQFTDGGLAKRKRESARADLVKKRWDQLKSRWESLSAMESEKLHRSLITDIRTMITHAGDTSNLILDPDLDSYYLMDVTLVALPQTQERIATTMMYGADLLRSDSVAVKDRVKLAAHAALLKEADLDRVNGDAQTSLNEDANFYGRSESLQSNLPKYIKEYSDATESFLALLARISETERSGVKPGELESAGERARLASFKLWTAAVGELDILLLKRIDSFKRDRMIGIGSTALAAIAAFFLVFFIQRSITVPMGKIGNALGGGAAEVAAASCHLSSSSQGLADGSSEQAASLEETSSAMEEMSAMTKRNAESAGQAKSLADRAGASVEKSNASMRSLVTSMAEISSMGEETGKIVKTIDEIAFQTNLLALNAAVEAARAGEAGAGFAVVADEVRNLAQRAAGAAKNTSELIEGTIKKIKDGTVLVEKTNADFGEVASAVTKVTELVAEISAASSEQSRGIDEVSTAIGQMDKVTQGNAAKAEEIASASEELSAQALAIEEVVRSLQSLVKGEGSAAARTASASQAAPAARRKVALPMRSARAAVGSGKPPIPLEAKTMTAF